jgi:hypothetical protein
MRGVEVVLLNRRAQAQPQTRKDRVAGWGSIFARSAFRGAQRKLAAAGFPNSASAADIFGANWNRNRASDAARHARRRWSGVAADAAGRHGAGDGRHGLAQGPCRDRRHRDSASSDTSNPGRHAGSGSTSSSPGSRSDVADCATRLIAADDQSPALTATPPTVNALLAVLHFDALRHQA